MNIKVDGPNEWTFFVPLLTEILRLNPQTFPDGMVTSAETVVIPKNQLNNLVRESPEETNP